MTGERDPEPTQGLGDGLHRRSFLGGAAALLGAGAVAACSGSVSPLVNAGSSGGPVNAVEAAIVPSVKWKIKARNAAPAALISGYSGRASVLPGEVVPLFVSTSADQFTAQVYRIGYYDGKGGALVTRAGPFPGRKQGGPRSDSVTRMVYAPWTKSAELDSTGWPPGQYLIHVTAKGLSAYVPLVVSSPDAVGKVIVVSSTTTLAAYNLWGGRNLYGDARRDLAQRSHAVSLDRPIDAEREAFLMCFEVSLAQAAESAGVPLAWMSNIDISQRPELVRGARGLVSPGHDEYWTTGFRDAQVKLRDAGGNLAYMGANAGYWRVRLGDTANGPGRRVICYKSSSLDPKRGAVDTTARWRDSPHPKPENQVVGQLYDAFPVSGPLQVVDPDFFLFAGTETREGEQFPRLVGVEIDRYYPDANAHRSTQLPAISPVTCRGKPTFSTVSYYTTQSGAGVFATGTMNWTRALPRNLSPEFTERGRLFVKNVTTNVFTAMAAGPLGIAHPASRDANAEQLPCDNTSGAAPASDAGVGRCGGHG